MRRAVVGLVITFAFVMAIMSKRPLEATATSAPAEPALSTATTFSAFPLA